MRLAEKKVKVRERENNGRNKVTGNKFLMFVRLALGLSKQTLSATSAGLQILDIEALEDFS